MTVGLFDILRSNQLLALMPMRSLEALQAHLTLKLLPARRVLIEPGASIANVQFLLDGIASQTGTSSHGGSELGLVGREGLVGSSVLLGVSETPHETVMEVAGSSVQIPVDEFSASLTASAPLREFLLKYVYVQQL